jgi:hypothetical protein
MPDSSDAWEAAAFRHLLEHLRERSDVQNIDLMTLAGFCRNCLADWYREAAAEGGVALSKDEARETVYGVPFAQWKAQYQKEAEPGQRAAFEAAQQRHAAITPVEFALDELIARPYRPDDAPALTEAVLESHASLSRWLDWCRPDYGLADAEQWIAACEAGWRSGDQYAFAVFDRGTNRFLGAAGISQRNRRYNYAGIGYWVRQSARGHAIAARVARHVATFGFERIGLGRIEILAAVDNPASRRTAERIGALFEGIQRQRLRVGGTTQDAATYSLVPGDLSR